jgi:hypothetical protein
MPSDLLGRLYRRGGPVGKSFDKSLIRLHLIDCPFTRRMSKAALARPILPIEDHSPIDPRLRVHRAGHLSLRWRMVVCSSHRVSVIHRTHPQAPGSAGTRTPHGTPALGEGLGLGVNRAKSDARVFSSVGNQPPSHHGDLALTGVTVRSNNRLNAGEGFSRGYC